MSKILTPQKALLVQPKNTTSAKSAAAAAAKASSTTTTHVSRQTTPTAGDNGTHSISSNSLAIDFDELTTSSSILEFLSREQECCSDVDAESIFQEVSRLADNSDTRSVDEILREAELLIQQQTLLGNHNATRAMRQAAGYATAPKKLNKQMQQQQLQLQQSIKLNEKYTKRIENVRTPVMTAKLLNGIRSECVNKTTAETALPAVATTPVAVPATPTPQTPLSCTSGHFAAFVDNLPSESVISEESTPQDMQTCTAATTVTAAHLNDDDDEGTDTLEEITEGIETIELAMVQETTDGDVLETNSIRALHVKQQQQQQQQQHEYNTTTTITALSRRLSGGTGIGVAGEMSPLQHTLAQVQQQHLASPTRRVPLNFNATQACSPSPCASSIGGARRASMTTPDSGIGITHNATDRSLPAPMSATSQRSCSDKSTNASPRHMVSSLTSPIEPYASVTREHALKHEIEQLQEQLKDTEERLQSLRIQHDSLSQLHRDLRESSTHLQEETELLKLDVQHLNECANVLRSELQSARSDRDEARELQKSLQAELEENRQDKKRTQEQRDKDTKTIQDLQRQCREMERILMRKHPDSVSALIVAAKSPGICANNDQENVNSRKLLEQRIAQLEADAKEQDHKAQQILANVQARFNSVQAKYETHIADLETQVLSLQEINTKLNEKIESQVRTLDYFVARKAEKYYNNCSQTEDLNANSNNAETSTTNTACTQTHASTMLTRDHSTNTIGSAAQAHSASSSTSSTANSTPNTSRPNSKQSGLRKPIASATGIGGSLGAMLTSKLPVSQSDSTIAHLSAAKEDAQLVATIRGMRVDLAIKDKAMQRLSRELDECKKTMRKLQREKEVQRPTSGINSGNSNTRRLHDDHAHVGHHNPATTESQALREAHNKIKLLEADYKSLHDKRLQDLKTLQTAHERELASCHETVRILQQRLSERDERDTATQKRRKLPVDYYALKAKVSSLERRHTEREERLHMLVEALSKGRLNGALEDLLASDNNNK